MIKKFLIYLTGVLFLFPLLSYGGVEATGSALIFNNNVGLAKSQALLNAQKNAVEQGVGLFLDANTITKNWQLIKDEIYTSSRGFVTSYKRLSEGFSKDRKSWVVTINAEVATANIKSKLQELRILHQKMGNKKFSVIYRPKTPKALKYDHSATQNTLREVEKVFISKGFRLYSLNDSLDQQHKLSYNQIKEKAAEKNVEMIVELQISGGRSNIGSSNKLSAVRPEVTLIVSDIQRNRRVSSTFKSFKKITNARFGSFAWEAALGQAASKAARAASHEAIVQIVEYYQEIGDIGNSFQIEFINYSEDEEDSLLRILENMEGFQSLIEKENSSGSLTIDYFSTTSKSRLRRLLKDESRKEKIALQFQIKSGNRLIVKKPGTEE